MIDTRSMTCPDIKSFKIQGQNLSPTQISFGLSIDSCRNLAIDPSKECESQDAIDAAIGSMYVTITLITHTDNAFSHAKGTSKMVIPKVDTTRYYLAPKFRDYKTHYLQKTTLGWSSDYFFGSSFWSRQTDTFYRLQDSVSTTGQYNQAIMSNGYLTLKFKQFGMNSDKRITPQNFIKLLSILGGFFFVLTNLTGFLLRNYQRFSYRKSVIKNLYYYSRTKKKVEDRGSDRRRRERMASTVSDGTIQLSDGSDFKEEDMDKQYYNDLTSGQKSFQTCNLNNV